MDRKEFLKKSLLTGAAAGMASALGNVSNIKVKNSTYDQMLKQVGFNHLPNKEEKTMNTVLHRAESRGHANHGWLNSHHSFSFANYYNPERMHFGVLRVLNDDVVSEGKGFGTHPHDNMEIISIPLEGDLEHQDSMGTKSVIREGDIQAMSAGTGVFHSEYNKNLDKAVKFLQIWIFPREKNVEPRYDQLSIREVEKQNKFYQILSPNAEDQGVWIHQDAWFHLGKFEANAKDSYEIKKEGNGVYAFVLEGEVKIEGQDLRKRDGFGVWNTDKIQVEATEDAKVLLMEVPMGL
ncbi:MAG: pirin family protein [Bacteroidota bacterium]